MGKGIVKLGDSKWATKDGNLLAYKETNNRFTNTEFTFARGTDATYVGEDGLIANETGDDTPRIDFLDDTDGHLLLEPASTNLVTYSEDFSQWQQIQNVTLTSNSTTSPSGESDATTVLSTDINSKISKTGLTFTNGVFYTFSVYCKNIDATALKFFIYMGGLGGDLTSDFTSEVNTDTWTRVSYTFTPTGTTAGGQVQIARNLPDTESAYFWGAQLEAGSYATSYIPTAGTTVTREAETCIDAGTAQDFNDTEGVLYAEIGALANDQTNRRITISDGSNENRIVTGYNTTSNQIFYLVVVGTSTIASGDYTPSDITEFSKIAIKYKENDFALWVDGTERATDASGAVFSADTLDSLQFEQGAGSSLFFYGKCKAIKVYKEALSDAELIALTT